MRYSQGANPTAVASFFHRSRQKIQSVRVNQTQISLTVLHLVRAEFIERYLRKGVKILTTGRIQNDNYTQ